MLRHIGGFFAGLILAFVLVQVAEVGVHAMNPPPPGTNMKDFAQVKRYVASLPMIALVLVLSGWLVGTVFGTFIAARVAQSIGAGYALTVVLLGAGVMNAIIIPQPAWFSALSFVIFVVAGLSGSRLGARRRESASAPPPASIESA